jgi:hypothetical protein
MAGMRSVKPGCAPRCAKILNGENRNPATALIKRRRKRVRDPSIRIGGDPEKTQVTDAPLSQNA